MIDENLILLEKLQQNPDLCGSFTIDSHGLIRWDLYKEHSFHIDVRNGDGYLHLFNRVKTHCSTAHWHPDPDDMYDELCKIGTRGHIIVVQFNHIGSLWGSRVIYVGPESNCPKRAKRKRLFREPLILKAQ